MHPYLIRLKVKAAVQSFFEPSYQLHESGDLLFPYGGTIEHFGLAFHKVPFTDTLWFGGNEQFAQVRQVMICSSAMEAISWLNNNYSSFASLDNLLFVATGARVCSAHIRFFSERLKGKTFGLLFGRDLLGRIADLKIAAGIRKVPVAVHLGDQETLRVTFRSVVYEFGQAEFSLPTFERVAKFRFKIPAYKPKGFDSFFDQLKANANLNF
jgi:hypothetical protein